MTDMTDLDRTASLPTPVLPSEPADAETPSCCSVAAQRTCCAPEDKSTCCSPESTSSGSCGCAE